MVTYSRLPLNTVLSMSLANESTQKAVDTVNQLPAFQPTVGTGVVNFCSISKETVAIFITFGVT